jgi:hypothetical protein
MNYVLGIPTTGPDAAVLTLLQEVEDDYELLKGVSRAVDFPSDAYFQFSPDFPRDILLEDFIKNENKVLVASERARELLESSASKNNEFLPVTIVDHKGRGLPEPYYIVHQVELQPCIDEAASEFEENAIDPERIYYMDRLVLDETRVDPEVSLFRMARFAKVPVFRRDLAERIQAAGLTGIVFEEIEGWEGS